MKKHETTLALSDVFPEEISSGRFGTVQKFSEKDIAKHKSLAAKSQQIVVTLSFKIKSLKPSLVQCLKQAACETNEVWNYCNDISHKAITQRNKWLSPFDLNVLMTGDTKFSPENPYGFQVINAAIAQCVASEYVTRRNQFKKPKLRWRKSTGSLSSGRSTSWIPFKEEHISITYPYSYIQTTTTAKIKTNKKTGEQTVSTVVKETVKHKTLRVAGKNTPEENLYALYSMDNDSGSKYGLPRCLETPTIKVLGTHLKIFNEEYLGYYLYHLGAIVKSGTLTENTIGEWFVNLAVAIDSNFYREKHCFGKQKIPQIAPREAIGIDPGAKTMAVTSDGTEYYSDGTTVRGLLTNPENSLSDNPPLSPVLKLQGALQQAQRDKNWNRYRRLHLKAKNRLKDATNKAALDIVRNAQWIKMGNLQIKTLVKNKTVALSPQDVKKRRSQRKRKTGQDKQQRLHNALQKNTTIAGSNSNGGKTVCLTQKGNTHKSKKKNPTTNTTVKPNKKEKQTKKRKGLGKSLLGQGIGQLKSCLSIHGQRTGRGYIEVNEAFTSQECCNCGRLTGPRGLRHLGVRKWVCGSDHQIGLFDSKKVKLVREGCGTTHLRDLCAARNLERKEKPLVKVQGLTQHPLRNGQAFGTLKSKRACLTKNQRFTQNTTGLSGSSLEGKN